MARPTGREIEQLLSKLVQACEDEMFPDARWEYKDQLVSAGKAAVPGLVMLLKHSSSWVRLLALDALGLIGDPAPTHIMERMVDEDPDPEVQAWAAAALGRLRDSKATGTLLRALCAADKGKRLDAVRALARLRSLEAIPHLEKLADQVEVQGDHTLAVHIRVAALYAERGLAALTSLLRNEAEDVERRRAAASFADLCSGKAAVMVLLESLRSGDEQLRSAALQSLDNLTYELKPQGTWLGQQMIGPLLETLSGDASGRNRMAAAWILGALANSDALPALEKAAAEDLHDSTRRAALESIQKCRRKAKSREPPR